MTSLVTVRNIIEFSYFTGGLFALESCFIWIWTSSQIGGWAMFMIEGFARDFPTISSAAPGSRVASYRALDPWPLLALEAAAIVSILEQRICIAFSTQTLHTTYLSNFNYVLVFIYFKLFKLLFDVSYDDANK